MDFGWTKKDIDNKIHDTVGMFNMLFKVIAFSIIIIIGLVVLYKYNFNDSNDEKIYGNIIIIYAMCLSLICCIIS